MAERLAFRSLFRREPVRAAEVAAGPPRAASEDRAGALARSAALSLTLPGRSRTAEPLLGLSRRMEHIFCLAPLWDLSEQIEADIAARTGRTARPGRKRCWPIMCALALDVALWEFGSIRSAVLELSDTDTWNRLRRKTEQAWPDHPSRRLPARPISRSQYHRARRRHTLPRLAEIKTWAETTSAEAARWIGMLDPRTAECATRLWPGNVIAGDTTYMKALSGIDPDNPGLLLDPHTGELTPRRCDPDARPYHIRTGSGVGHRCLVLSTRHGHPVKRTIRPRKQTIRPRKWIIHPNERIIHSIGPIGPGSDATAFTDTILRLQKEQTAFAAGAAAAVYDGALHADDMTRLQDNAVIPIAKTHRSNRKYATANLGQRQATLPGGGRRRVAVTAIDGTPTIAAADADGELWHIPLIRTKTRIRRNKHRPAAIHTRWRIPTTSDNPESAALAGPLAGATLGIRHNPDNPREALRINRALRIIPPSDEDYDDLYGLREDVESTNNHLKERLRHGRAPTIGTDRIQLNLIGYQIHTLITTLTNWQRRTSGDLTPWFGQHPAP